MTKRPLVLTLHNTSNRYAAVFENLISSSGGGKWAELPDEGGSKITNFIVLEKKIGSYNSKFTASPLRVDIYSPDVVDLLSEILWLLFSGILLSVS